MALARDGYLPDPLSTFTAFKPHRRYAALLARIARDYWIVKNTTEIGGGCGWLDDDHLL